LSKEERALLRLPGGLLVEKVEMAAARAGLRAGDLLLNMNGRALDSVEQVSGILRRKPDIVALLVQRGAERNFIAVELR
jgi:serine protease Do